jgi:hypothetical protein
VLIKDLKMVLDECMKHLYYFGVTCCASNAFCVINCKVLRQWRQEFYGR